MNYIDIHTHLNFAAFDDDRDEVINRALSEGVGMINVGTQLDTSRKAVEIAERYEEGVYATVGVHPIHTKSILRDKDEVGGEGFRSRAEGFDVEDYTDLLSSKKVVAIGECGLDYFHAGEDSKKRQREVFESQLDCAEEYELPVMLHLRSGDAGDAYKDAYEILRNRKGLMGGNAHFFAGSTEDIKRFLELNITLSFTGVVTFVSSYKELVCYPPLDMIMAETDAPYVAPEPHRGRRNEPLFVKQVADRIASLRPEPDKVVLQALTENARRRFRL